MKSMYINDAGLMKMSPESDCFPSRCYQHQSYSAKISISGTGTSFITDKITMQPYKAGSSKPSFK
jgi:hypothetical protein